MSTEIITTQPTESIAPAKPTTERAMIMAQSLKEDTEQRILVRQYVEKHMTKDVDFGVIPGTNKPTLLKPGAEKLTDLFRCTPSFEILNRIEDWDKGLFHYEFRVRITSRDAGTVLAEGFGSANSREGRYRWRNAGRKCPHCGKETIIKGKEDFGGGWLCFGKKGGCGAKWKDGDPVIEQQTQGKVENDDIYTLVNTILKMAKKRALVDGAIALARCSDIFTQDIEDFADQHEAIEPSPQQKSHDERKATIRENLTGDGKPQTNGELGAVLAGIANAQTLEELVTVQPAAAKLKNGDIVKARKSFAARRDELSAKEEPPPAKDEFKMPAWDQGVRTPGQEG
jgi:hypothetical protein